MIEEIKIDRLEELIHEMMIKIRNTSVTNTEEGNPIEIENAAAAPLVNCVSAITGSQDLNGYDKPWVGGAGKNKISDGTDSSNGYVNNKYIQYDGSFGDSAEYFVTEYFPISQNQYIWSSSGNPNSPCIAFYDSSKTFISTVKADNALPKIITPPSNAVYCRASQYQGVNATKYMQLELGSTATTFAPYSNICPITAFSTGSVEVEDEDEQSTTYAATFTDPIYQGSIDYVAKKTTATWGYIASYDGETLPGRWISDRDEYAPGTTPTTGAEVAYELESAAVKTVTVSNAPVSAVHGYNKIESSTGYMEVTYITEDFEPLVPTT